MWPHGSEQALSVQIAGECIVCLVEARKPLPSKLNKAIDDMRAAVAAQA
jgi:hypothetical protein